MTFLVVIALLVVLLMLAVVALIVLNTVRTRGSVHRAMDLTLLSYAAAILAGRTAARR